MANRARSIGSDLTPTERIFGFLYLPFYFFLVSFLLQIAVHLLGWTLTDFHLNLLYYLVNFAVILLIFHRFLARSLRPFINQFWSFIQALILGFALYYVGTLLLLRVLLLLKLSVSNANNEAVEQLFLDNQRLMLLCTLIAAPIVEEVLVRGLIFGSLYRVGRVLAYAVSILVFSGMHVWQYAWGGSLSACLLVAAQYVPASIALCWTYERAKSIWVPILLHAIVNTISYFALI